MEFWRLIWVGLGDVAHFVLVLAETAPPTVTKVVVEKTLLLTDTVSFLRGDIDLNLAIMNILKASDFINYIIRYNIS